MILYKYLPPERVDVLRDRRIRLTQPAEFNDPFDCSPSFTTLDATGVSVDDVGAACGPGGDKGCLDAQLHVLQTIMRLQDHQAVGVLSLAERPDNVLMWAHYGRSHRGFVIGFDTRNPFFMEDAHLAKVGYARARPSRSYDFTGHLGQSVTVLGPAGDRTKLDDDWLFTKSCDWKYEREWRLIKSLSSPTTSACSVIARTNALPIHLFPFPESAVTAVILGCNAWNALHPVIGTILRETPAYRHVMLWQTDADDRTFRLIQSPLPEPGKPYGPWARSLDRRRTGGNSQKRTKNGRRRRRRTTAGPLRKLKDRPRG